VGPRSRMNLFLHRLAALALVLGALLGRPAVAPAQVGFDHDFEADPVNAAPGFPRIGALTIIQGGPPGLLPRDLLYVRPGSGGGRVLFVQNTAALGTPRYEATLAGARPTSGRYVFAFDIRVLALGDGGMCAEFIDLRGTSVPSGAAKPITGLVIDRTAQIFKLRTAESDPLIPTDVVFEAGPDARFTHVAFVVHLDTQRRRLFADGREVTTVAGLPFANPVADLSGLRIFTSDNSQPADSRVAFEVDNLVLFLDSDFDGLTDSADPAVGDADADDDGLLDGGLVERGEDLNGDGSVAPDAGETDPLNFDTDGDGLPDGLERGLSAPVRPAATDLTAGCDTPTGCHFIPDADPSTTTDPNDPDTDGDGLPDGEEDANHNGRWDPGETSANGPDSDFDGYSDGMEVRAGTDPLDPDDFPPDEDLDLVPDGLDRCPGTAPGAIVDRDGCDCDQLACDDGNACNGPETCVDPEVGCESGEPPLCDDGIACTIDVCDVPLNGCKVIADDRMCDDGNACTDDVCDPGAGCRTADATGRCDDGNPCTDDHCDPLGGCSTTVNTAPCDDGDACTQADTCAAGACVGGAPASCDDGNPCTDDSCHPQLGCVVVNNQARCDDGDACTENDRCAEGICAAGTPPTDGVRAAACAIDALEARLEHATSAELGTGGDSARRKLAKVLGGVRRKHDKAMGALAAESRKASRQLGIAAKGATAFGKKATKFGRRKISIGLAADLAALAETLADRLVALRASLS
jgi:hypothetical protein